MMGKFRGKVDFSDSPNGFFGFVRETFEQLAKEEEYAADYEDVDIPSYPSFGHKDDTYDDVVRDFYAIWNGFATVKAYAWMDVYRLSDAPDRRTRRLMEKENQKRRDDGRREFNEAVRTLITFVRRRDPRYTPSTESAEEKAKAQRDARQAQAAKARAEKLAKLDREAQELPDWATARPADELEEESEEEIEEDHYECVACNKTFKSERQYEAHEKSKKHQKAIQALKRKMQKDNAHLDLDKDAISSGVITPAEDVEEEDLIGSEAEEIDEAVDTITTKTNDMNIEDDAHDEKLTDDEEQEVDTPENSRNPNTNNDSASLENTESESTSDDEYTSRSTLEARLNSQTTSSPTSPPDTPADASSNAPKVGKAALKRAKKAAKQASTDQEVAEQGIKCLGCDASFPSNTQLYNHLQQHPKHAALKSVAGGGGKGKKKGKR